MSFNFKVNTTKLRQLAVALRNMPMAVREDAARRLIPKYEALVEQGFNERAAPDGTPWPTPKAGNTPLERTGALRRGYRFEIVPAGTGVSIKISNTQSYSKYLKDRPQVPEANKPIPQRWADAARDSYREAVAVYKKRNF